MKNLLTKGLWFLIAVALITSCSEEHDIFSDNTAANTVISASSDGHSSPYTRTQVGGVANDGSLVIQWSANDKIGVFGTSANNVQFTSTNSAPSDKADFSGSLAATSVPQKAYYPYSETVNDITAIPMAIPAKQVYNDVTSLAAYDFKAAASCDVLGNGTYHMNFRQMATVLRMQIELEGVNNLAATEKAQSVEVAVDGCALSGDYTYNLNNLDEPLKNVSATDAAKSVTVELANKPLVSDKVIAYAVIAPGAKKDAIIRISITTDKHKATFSTNLLGDIRAGVFYDLPLTATVVNTKEDLKVEDVVEPTPDPTPTEETANCYMINTIGEHDFCATQIGNGDKGIIPNAGFHVTSSKISPKSAKLMWQDVENFIDASSIRLVNGRVHYTANKNSGNAMIAVYSGENCTGEILWSWHIWGVGDTMPVDEVIKNQAGATFTVMNRTLGTHDANSYFATLYQWGRKDPFPNSSFYYLADGSKVDISQNFPTYRPINDDVSILTSVQNCDKMIYPFNWDGAPNWLNYENQHLWGDSSTRDHYTWWDSGRLSNSEAGAGWAEQKTIYDPSPVGYRVANKFTFSGFVKREDGIAKVDGAFNEGQVEEWLYVITEPRPGQEPGHYIYWWPKFNNGFYFKRNSADTEGTYFPNSGYRYPNGDNASAGVEGSYNYSAPNKNANLVDYFHIGKYEWRDKDNLNGAGNHCELAVQEHDIYGEKAIARAIRCVKDE